MKNVHKIDTRLIAIPIEAQTDDCGAKYCKVPQLVLSDKADTTNWKNDRTAIAFKFDSMTVKLVSETEEIEAVGYVFTFPNQADATGFVIDWRQNEYGCFKIKIEWEIAGISGWFYYGQYTHRPYTCENANGTVRLFVHLDDFVRKQGINYKGSGFYGTIRFNGIFGYMQPNYDTENLIYSDRVRHKVRIEAVRSYELRTDQLLYAMSRLIDEDVLLTANNILVTDHNLYNHSQEFKDFPVILSESESPKFEYSNPYSSITAVFNEKVAVSESRYSSDINAPIPIVQTVITTPTESATITLDSEPFLTLPSGSNTNITLQDEDGNPIDPVGSVGSAIVVPNSDTILISGTAPLMRTGQTTSFATGDDGNLKKGRNLNTLTAPPLHADGSPTVNTTTNRFTDELGGQTYTNNIMIDWATWDALTAKVLGYRRTGAVSDVIWSVAMSTSASLSIGSYTSGWRLTNLFELMNLARYEPGVNKFNWSPLNYNVAVNLWTSTNDSTNAFVINHLGWANPNPKGNAGRFFACRDFTAVGTTLI